MMRSRKRYPGPGGMLICSFLLHLALLLALTTFQFLPHFKEPEQATYYVDMVSLPVASPQQGTPSPAPKAQHQSPPAAPEPSEPAAVALPAPRPQQKAQAKTRLPAQAQAKPQLQAKAPPRTTTKAQESQASRKQTPQPGPSEESREIDDRIAKLERQVEDRRISEAMDNLRKRGNGRQGIPGGKGNEAGSDYSAYIYSRLKDAFSETYAAETKSPQVRVRLFIGADGRLLRYQVEQRSGDKMFDDAVDRAVHIAARSFRKPPNGMPFEQGFVFRPQWVGIR